MHPAGKHSCVGQPLTHTPEHSSASLNAMFMLKLDVAPAIIAVAQWGAGAEASVSNAADAQFDSLLGFLSTVPKKGGSFGRLQYGEQFDISVEHLCASPLPGLNHCCLK